MLDSIFNSNKTLNLDIQTKSQTKTNGQLGPEVWTTTKSLKCVFWRGSLSPKVINQRIQPDVAGVILCRPEDVSKSEIPAFSRCVLYEDTIGALINNVAGHNTGSTTINIDSVNDSQNPVKRNDTFTVSGETGSPTHTVSSTIKTGSVTTQLTFTDGLASNIADNTLLTITKISGIYSVIYPDDIGEQNRVIMIPVKEFT